MKKTLALLLVLTLMLSFVACGGDDNNDNSAENNSAAGTLKEGNSTPITEVDKDFKIKEIMSSTNGQTLYLYWDRIWDYGFLLDVHYIAFFPLSSIEDELDPEAYSFFSNNGFVLFKKWTFSTEEAYLYGNNDIVCRLAHVDVESKIVSIPIYVDSTKGFTRIEYWDFLISNQDDNLYLKLVDIYSVQIDENSFANFNFKELERIDDIRHDPNNWIDMISLKDKALNEIVFIKRPYPLELK